MKKLRQRFHTFLGRGFGHIGRSTVRRSRSPMFDLLEDRTVPTILTQIANVDGYVADVNQDGLFDTVNTTGASVQTTLIPASGSSATDQSNTPSPYQTYSTSYGPGLPIGQEFKPAFSSLDFVDLFIEDHGSDTGPGANFTVNIRANTITGTVLGSASAFVADNTNLGGGNTYTHFSFSSSVALTPGATYIIDVVQNGPIVTGNSVFSLDGDNPNGTDLYTAGRAIIGGAPVTNNFDFNFREGTSSTPGITERGVMEFSTAGITASSVINSVTLTGTVGLLQYTGAQGGVDARFYGYAGNGQITTADATASSTSYGLLTNAALGTFT